MKIHKIYRPVESAATPEVKIEKPVAHVSKKKSKTTPKVEADKKI